MSFNHHPCTKPEWLGLPIDVYDKTGTELRIGDRVRFDEKAWGGKHEFIVGFERGEVLFDGSANDSEYMTIVKPYAAAA